MKIILQVYFSIAIILLILISDGCKKDENLTKIIKEKVTGHVQKGPFINGTSISISELNSSLVQTGKIFTTQIVNNSGSFEINNISLSTRYAEFAANGYYFDEVKGIITISPLILYALSDINDISTVNVNILTHLEKLRVDYLVKQNKPFLEAKKIAQSEILAIFSYSLNEMHDSETLDITVNNEENAILLAISIILQGNRSMGALTELLANFNNNIREDGILNSDTIITNLRNSTKELVLSNIRSNLENRYQELGIPLTIPGFEKYINDFLAFTGEKPVTLEQSAKNITTTSVTLNGVVNPNSLSTIVNFEYGKSIIYVDSIKANQSPVNGNFPIDVKADISELSPGTIYHFRVKAGNAKGTTYSSDQTFTTSGQAPTSAAIAVSDIQSNTATLNGSVNPNYLMTTVTFEWGTTTGYGDTITATQSPVTGNSSVTVSAGITGLSPGRIYHFRIKAENTLGISYSNDLIFTTYFTGLTGTIVDIEGNRYKTIGIHTHMWMAENLKTTKYNDGTDIPLIIGQSNGWGAPAYMWYNDDATTYKPTYGALYNWYAVNTGKLCPTGWHVPILAEWNTLIAYLGGESVAGGKLKETGTTHWLSPNTGATNETGFTALPGGGRTTDLLEFLNIGREGYWWSSTVLYDSTDRYAYLMYLQYNESKIGNGYQPKRTNYSVRCIKDY